MKLGTQYYGIYGRSLGMPYPEVKRSNDKVTPLRKHHGRMAAAAWHCGRCATAAGVGLRRM